MKLLNVTFMVFVTFAIPSVYADDNVSRLTTQLIDLRGEIDALSSEIALQREEQKQRLKYLYVQDNELQAQNSRDQSSLKKLKKNLQKNRNSIRLAGSDSAVLKPIVIDAIEQLEIYVQSSLPFKRSERLGVLREFKHQLETDVSLPQKSANRLWAFIEDEIRLTKENGVFRQTIWIDEEEILSDVARLGMVAMFFKIDDENLGTVRRKTDGSWEYTLVESSAGMSQIESLFGAFKKQIRSGLFELPNSLSVEGNT